MRTDIELIKREFRMGFESNKNSNPVGSESYGAGRLAKRDGLSGYYHNLGKHLARYTIQRITNMEV